MKSATAEDFLIRQIQIYGNKKKFTKQFLVILLTKNNVKNKCETSVDFHEMLSQWKCKNVKCFILEL